MAKQFQIEALHAAGWSRRRIAKELKINRRTVSRYIAGLATDESKCTSEVTAGSKERKSACEPFRNLIISGVEKGQGADLIVWPDIFQQTNGILLVLWHLTGHEIRDRDRIPTNL